MTQFEKIWEKFKENPTKTKYKDIEKILLKIGFKKRSGKGSHIVFKKENCSIIFAIHNGDSKESLKKAAFISLKRHNLL